MEKLETDIIQRARLGNNEARSELYNTHVKLLYGYLYNKLGAAQDAEDICQETFLRAFKNLHSFQEKASFKNWLFQIAKNIIADHWKAHYKANTIYVDDFFGFAEVPKYEIESEQVEKQEHTSAEADRELSGILDQLSDEYRSILEYRFLKGYSLKETAEALDISVSNAKVRQFRAIQKAKQLIQNHD